MSQSFVLVGYDWESTLNAASDICSIQKSISSGTELYRLQMSMPADYAMKKRIALSNAVGVPGDDIQQSADYCTVFLYKTDDTENTWFEGSATSINHPELILSALSDKLDTEWYSENDREYWDISDMVNGESDDITEDDLPKEKN